MTTTMMMHHRTTIAAAAAAALVRVRTVVASSSSPPPPGPAVKTTTTATTNRRFLSTPIMFQNDNDKDNNDTTINPKLKKHQQRSSLFSCPADNDKFLQKSFDRSTLDKGMMIFGKASTIVLDLEDGVAPHRKDIARRNVVEILSSSSSPSSSSSSDSGSDSSKSTSTSTSTSTLMSSSALDPDLDLVSTPSSSELAVRINALDTGMLALQDLQSIIPLPKLQTIVIPKVESTQDIEFVSRLIDMTLSSSSSSESLKMEDDSTTTTDDENVVRRRQRPIISILAAIESASGLMQVPNIAAFNNNNHGSGSGSTFRYSKLDGLIFASEDYCADVGLKRTVDADELLYARSTIVTAAKAFGLQAIDMVHIDYKNLDDLRRECNVGRDMGFTGKQAIHPSQIETINDKFGAASAQDLKFATKVVERYETIVLQKKQKPKQQFSELSSTTPSTTAAAGACVVDGIVVDAPVYKWALKILGR